MNDFFELSENPDNQEMIMKEFNQLSPEDQEKYRKMMPGLVTFLVFISIIAVGLGIATMFGLLEAYRFTWRSGMWGNIEPGLTVLIIGGICLASIATVVLTDVVLLRKRMRRHEQESEEG